MTYGATMPRQSGKSETRVGGRLWIDKDDTSFLGKGRIELLERIADHGSISAAARAMGMSYKAAWDAVDAMNNLAEEPLVVRITGGKHGGGTSLTEYGHRMIQLFRVIEGEYNRFLGGLSAGIGDFDSFYALMKRFSLKTSARNQYQGRVGCLIKGAVNAEVVIDIAGGDSLVAIITLEAAECLRLEEGSEVYAMVKESSVILADEGPGKVSTRNRLCGTVMRCQEGAINGEVQLQLAGGRTVTAIITNASIRALGLREGVRTCALIKATDVILAVND
jgi:molybdate transport system regulatory protein